MSVPAKVALGLILLFGADLVALFVAWGTCGERSCAGWHLWLDSAFLFALPVLIVLAMAAVLVTFVDERRRNASQR